MTQRILVVDDDEPIRELCKRSLTRLGYDVETAQSGDDAVTRFEFTDFDFVLTDVIMPGKLDGLGLVQEVKRRSPSTDVVVMTAFPDLETAVSILKSGAYDYLMKPFDTHLLNTVVQRCFEKRRLDRELDREKSLRQELEAAYSELQKVERAKDAFLARINHELKTPLTAALWALECIAPREGDDEQNRLHEMAHMRLKKMQQMVDNLILFSKTYAAGFKCEQLETDLKGLLEKVAENYRPQLDEKQIGVEWKLDENAGALWADDRLLETAFKHLFLNAVQFNKPGGKIRVETRLLPEGEVEILFFNTGIRIPPELQSRIFDSFYQAAEYLTREVGGLGLGLAIVRRIIEAHGGRIVAESASEAGSEFRVFLPHGRSPALSS